MTDEERKEPDYISKVAAVEFNDQVMERLRGQLIAKLRALLAPISTQWGKIERDQRYLSAEAKDPMWRSCRWPRYAISLIEELENYKTLKENEMQHFADFIIEFSARLEETSETPKEAEPPDPEFIKIRVEEIIKTEPSFPLRKIIGKRTIQGELNKEFGKESFDVIENIISEIEASKNEH